MSSMFRAALPLWLLAAGGCATQTAAPPDGGTHDAARTCLGDEDCPAGYACGGGICVAQQLDAGLDAGAPALTITPDVVDLGSPLLGHETQSDLVLASTGTGDLTILAVQLLDPAGLGEFSLAAPAAPFTIAAGDEAHLTVSLLPKDRLVDSGFLVVTSDDPATPSHVVRLVSSIKGVPEVALCALVAGPGSVCRGAEVDFGLVPYGGSAEQVLAIHNAGDGNAVVGVTAVVVPAPPVVPVPLFSVTLTTLADDPAHPGQQVEVPAALPVLLVPGDGATAPVTLFARIAFAAATDREIPDLVVAVQTDDITEPTITVPLRYSIDGCPAGWYDLDHDRLNGCEYHCAVDPPVAEVCDGIDNNCDGRTDEGFDLLSDLANCGSCGHACHYDHAAAACVDGGCVMEACDAGWVDADRRPTDGCEYACTPTNGGVEICDGLDNDCNGLTDEGVAQNSDPTNCGGCGTVCSSAHAAAVCASGICQLGACDAGWHNANNDPADGCEYACTPTNGGVEVCDGVDNDCDGQTDEGFDTSHDPANCGACGVVCAAPDATPDCALGQCVIGACDPGHWDVNGEFADGCEYACTQTNGGVEICDGVDNDCNGLTDEGFDTSVDPQNCGVCGHVCQSNGLCCAGACTDTSDSNCGACGHACAGSTHCFSSACIVPGLIVVTEMMINPAYVSDSVGEWFEVYNPGTLPVNLRGWVLSDTGSDSHTVTADVTVPARGYAVLGINKDPLTNGGILVAYQYSNFLLANAGDEIILTANGIEVDRVVYSAAGGWTVPAGASLSLKPSELDATANDSAANWCRSTTPLPAPSTDKGTPAAANVCP